MAIEQDPYTSDIQTLQTAPSCCSTYRRRPDYVHVYIYAMENQKLVWVILCHIEKYFHHTHRMHWLLFSIWLHYFLCRDWMATIQQIIEKVGSQVRLCSRMWWPKGKVWCQKGALTSECAKTLSGACFKQSKGLVHSVWSPARLANIMPA